MEILSQTDFIIPRDSMTGGMGEAFSRPSGRSAGLHLGEVFRDIENRALKQGQRLKYHQLRPEEQARMGRYVEVGFIWEMLVEWGWRHRMGARRRNRVVSQVEMEADGIIMTPDGFDPIDDLGIDENGVVEEYKATWRTSRRWAEDPESNFWEWLERVKCYCRVHGTRRCRFFILWVNGDYKESGPQSWVIELLFTQREIEEAWAMAIRHRGLMLKEGWDGE